MDSMLCASVRNIKAVNQQGVTKMIRNILALQQNLRNIVIADTSKLTSVGKQSRQGLDAGRAAINEDFERWNNFDKSKGLWELLSKEPNVSPAAENDLDTHIQAARLTPAREIPDHAGSDTHDAE